MNAPVLELPETEVREEQTVRPEDLFKQGVVVANPEPKVQEVPEAA